MSLQIWKCCFPRRNSDTLPNNVHIIFRACHIDDRTQQGHRNYNDQINNSFHHRKERGWFDDAVYIPVLTRRGLHVCQRQQGGPQECTDAYVICDCGEIIDTPPESLLVTVKTTLRDCDRCRCGGQVVVVSAVRNIVDSVTQVVGTDTTVVVAVVVVFVAFIVVYVWGCCCHDCSFSLQIKCCSFGSGFGLSSVVSRRLSFCISFSSPLMVADQQNITEKKRRKTWD
jgi:hypothetical protein